jgi:hypothetical protein
MTPPASPIHCHDGMVSLTDALAKQFPVCHALVGDEFFRAMAGIFIELSPRCAPVLATYGDDFADFIDSFPLARPLPYLGDVARLEAARTSAWQASDAPRSAFTSLPPSPHAIGTRCGWNFIHRSGSSGRAMQSSPSGSRAPRVATLPRSTVRFRRTP